MNSLVMRICVHIYSLRLSMHTHIHTHTIYIYIYIYICNFPKIGMDVSECVQMCIYIILLASMSVFSMIL